jgi:tape measure domain-containing protein
LEDIAVLGLSVDSRQVTLAAADLKSFEMQAGKAEHAAKGLETAAGLLTKAMGFLGAVLSVQQLIRMTSAWTDLNSRVANAVGSHEAAAAAMKRIDEMARLTYSSLDQTAETFLRNSKALKELGYSTDKTFDFVESLNNALVVSGAKGERAAQVMNALSKAIGLGKLSGENLNTVLATGGRVAEALADGLGVSTLQLRKLGSEGKLTTSKVIEALTSQLEKLRNEAEAMPATIEDAFTLMGNAILKTVGKIDEYTKASATMADAIIAIGDNIDIVIPVIGALAGILVVALIPALVATTAAFAAFALTPIGLIALGIGALAAAATYFWNEGRKAAQAAEEMNSSIKANNLSLEAAKTGTREYREELHKQIETQLRATAATLALADAQTLTSRKYVASLQTSIKNNPLDLGARVALPFAQNDERNNMAKSLALDAAYQKIEQQLAELDALGPGKPGAKPPGLPDDAAGKAAKAYDDLVKSAGARIDQMKVEAATLGMTDAAALSLTNTQDLMNEATKAGIDLWSVDAETGELRIQQILKLSDSLTEAQLRLEGLHMTMANRAPWDAMGDAIANLQEQLDKGNIGVRDFQLGVGQAVEEMVRSYASTAGVLLDSVEMLTQNMGLKGKEAFEMQKQLSMARAVVAGGEAIVHAYNAGAALPGGPVTGAIFAGVAAAATAAQIASIASTTYTSKSLNASAASGGSAGSSAAAPASSGTAINLTIKGSGVMNVDDFANQLTKGIADGGHQALINVIRAA